MKLLMAALVLVAAHHCSEARRYKVIPDVNGMCDSIECPDDKVCRVVEKCGKKRKSQAKCIPCVPTGTDDICLANSFLKTVLVGSSKSLTPLYCHTGYPDNRFECPRGSQCIEDPKSPGHGVCCYGEVHVLFQGVALTNDDPVCNRCKPECERGYNCELDIFCGKLGYTCVPEVKDGVCPNNVVYPVEGQGCRREEKKDKCGNDQDCPGSQKCCGNHCGGKSCQLPAVYDYKDTTTAIGETSIEQQHYFSSSMY